MTTTSPCPNCPGTLHYSSAWCAHRCTSCGWLVTSAFVVGVGPVASTAVPSPSASVPDPLPVLFVVPGQYSAFDATLYRGSVVVLKAVGYSAGTAPDGRAATVGRYTCRWAGATTKWVADAVELGRMGVPVSTAGASGASGGGS